MTSDDKPTDTVLDAELRQALEQHKASPTEAEIEAEVRRMLDWAATQPDGWQDAAMTALRRSSRNGIVLARQKERMVQTLAAIWQAAAREPATAETLQRIQDLADGKGWETRPPSPVEQWRAQLGSEDRTVRERAAKELHHLEAHPDFEYEMTESARKSSTSLRPDGDGWEPNMHRIEVDHDRAWERFEFSEREYWMRRKP